MISMMDGRPIGEPVDPAPASPPTAVTLNGRYATLEPLNASMHGDALHEAVCGRDDLWTYLFEPPPANRAAFDEMLARKGAAVDRVYFAIVDARDGRARGYASYLRIDPAHRTIEVGDILLSPPLQRTAAATDAMYLMAAHAFDALGYRRYEWKCNALNAPSMRAAERLGFVYEGTFRQHMIVKSRNRDTAWFAMIDAEWPARKAAFERWLEPSNFDEQGNQRISLTSLNSKNR